MTLDIQLFYLINSLAGHTAAIDWLIIFFAKYLPYLLVILFAAFVYFYGRTTHAKWEMVIVGFGAGFVGRYGIAELIRHFYHHPRPFAALPGVHTLLTDSSWSFPSGHSIFFFALSTVLYLYNKKWGIGFFIASALVVIARVAAGAHYPSDIIGGAAFGVALGYAAWAIARGLKNSRGR